MGDLMNQLLKLGLLSAIAAIGLSASTITLTYSGTASGFLGQNSFSDSAFTVTGVGDTANIFVNRSNSSVLELHLDSASVDIAGQGIFSITNALGALVAQSPQLAAFVYGDGPAADFALIESAVDPSLGSWDLASSIGPITGSGSFPWWGLDPVNTTGGTLIFFDTNTPITFQATVGNATPEPGSALLLISGTALLALTGLRRRLAWRTSTSTGLLLFSASNR
jgi:hypothetical protein